MYVGGGVQQNSLFLVQNHENWQMLALVRTILRPHLNMLKYGLTIRNKKNPNWNECWQSTPLFIIFMERNIIVENIDLYKLNFMIYKTLQKSIYSEICVKDHLSGKTTCIIRPLLSGRRLHFTCIWTCLEGPPAL